ncbi:MAG: prepilin-type N-terminal cleavage/methylation domain-containing protein [Desulfobacterales bacterium]|nr:MAG: prepilin-type N-terminal cleavage/methylation domain-containing protein [Desulfobacterales bacterium]
MIIDHSKPPRGGHQKGLTLIEVLAAVSIFAIGIVAVGSMLISATRNNTTGNMITQATLLARNQLETLKNEIDITALELKTYYDPNNPINAQGQKGGIFTRTWKITAPSGLTTVRHIQVTVKTNQQGKNREVVLTSISGGNGI